MGMWPAQPLAQPEAQSRAQSRTACVVFSTSGPIPPRLTSPVWVSTTRLQSAKGTAIQGQRELGLERALISWLPTQGNLRSPELSPRHPERGEHSWAFTHSLSSHPPFIPTK